MESGQVNWRRVLARPGDWCCDQHGIIEPITDGPVPYCPACRRIALQAQMVKGKLVYVEPHPEVCRNGHPLGPGTISHSRRGSATTWRCLVCDDVQQWPPAG